MAGIDGDDGVYSTECGDAGGILHQPRDIADPGALTPAAPVFDSPHGEHQVVPHFIPPAPVLDPLPHQRSGDDLTLHFGRTLAEPLDPQVAKPSFQRQFGGYIDDPLANQ
nr:hypothetical protein [Mycobacterium avium]